MDMMAVTFVGMVDSGAGETGEAEAEIEVEAIRKVSVLQTG